jgi:hypothetical protein
MIAAVVSVFALCWLPLTTINLANDLIPGLGHWYYYELLFFTFHCFAMSSTCYNREPRYTYVSSVLFG